MKRKRSRRPRRPPHSFYSGDSVSDPGEPASARLPPVDSPGSRIALLRAQLEDAIDSQPHDVAFLLRSSDVLIRATVAEHRLSPPSAKSLADRMKAVLDTFSDQILPTND